MSVHALTVVLGDGGEVGRSDSEGYARLVLIAIAHRASDRGFCWPSVADLAKQANVHRGTVNRRLDDLLELGELRMFTRGHYQSPAFVMTRVNYPLSTEEILDLLTELDPRVSWQERIPGQGSLPFERSSQTATISVQRRDVDLDQQEQAPDQGFYPAQARENEVSAGRSEIVAERDDPSRSATIPPGDIVAERDEIVAVARRSSEPTENIRTTTTTTTGLPVVAERDDLGGGGGEAEPRKRWPHLVAVRWAQRWCEITGKTFTGKLADSYIRQVQRFLTDHPEPTEEFLRSAAAEGIKHPAGWAWINRAADADTATGAQNLIDACGDCDDRGMRWYTADGQPTRADDIDVVTGARCLHTDLEEATG